MPFLVRRGFLKGIHGWRDPPGEAAEEFRAAFLAGHKFHDLFANRCEIDPRGQFLDVMESEMMFARDLFWLSLLAMLTLSVPGSTLWAQQSGEDPSTSPARSQQAEEDLNELAQELEAAEAEEQSKAAEQAAAAREAMQSYESRAARQALEMKKRLLENPAWRPTHEQVSRLELSVPLNNMCLDKQGRILACCGDSTLRVLAQDGQLVATHSLDFVPEAITVRHDGTVFVGGQGTLIRMTAAGEIQQQTSFPPPPSEQEREAMVQKMLARVEQQYEQMQRMSRGIQKQLESAGKKLAENPLSAAEEKKLASMGEEELFRYVTGITSSNNQMQMTFRDDATAGVRVKVLELYLRQLGAVDIKEQRAAMEQQVRRQAEQMVGKAKYTGMAVTQRDLFVICSGPGYSYNAWRMTHQFEEPNMILSGLSGCCGQMDCQAHDGQLWLAMNTQHKVLCYDREGNQVSQFGKRDAQAADGFGGCCEPKNLRFSQDGRYVYCAQSGPPVCVKRFTLDGQFQDVVCFPVYATGCVRVSVDTDGETFFMMSPNENAIYVFKPAKT